ncbi:uncharacterized protein MYCGRDRAFT_89085 [Zymoseptoria tritici IPO323]|uniref:Uncharacterized protein n=1 Tax=Zymoseptoria tritici (strain CBS 115943 / IPO323) TaxID=336722 RepID=F9WXS9_ZYMTI|nr:uncharacterized protein MYCGRDRAFT_89085 [Zymoseptoria tritici IPO323]EGP91081.1 hypothetical protein MYCGRDRAFT_89085 [Zymoseptoria tritici IPO323]
MCQYYHWRCGVCLTDNEIARRCGRMRERCAKNGDLLPLPPDAEGISCQWCRRPRFVDQKQAPPRFRHAVKPIQSTSKCPVKTEAQWRVPAENDAFWLRPSTRLPDAAEKMAQYNHQRHLVFKASDQAIGLKQDSREGTNTGSNGQSFLYDEAWRKLKERLQIG